MNGKIALGVLGGIGLITTVSVVSSRSGSSDPSWAKEMPSFSFLSADTTFMSNSQDNSSSRFGYMYAEFLVGDVKTNNAWWKWSYENLTKDLKKQSAPSADAFKVVQTPPQIPNSEVSLKNWCSEIYEADVGSQKPFDLPNSIFNNDNIWKYCSPAQQPPISLQKSKVTYSEGTIGNKKASVLLDANKNGRIWYYRNKLFDEIKADEFWSESDGMIFKEGRKKGRKVQDICADAYGQNMEGFPVGEVMFFCSISPII